MWEPNSKTSTPSTSKMSVTPPGILLSTKPSFLSPSDFGHMIQVEKEIRYPNQNIEGHTSAYNTAPRPREPSHILSCWIPLNVYRPFHHDLPHNLSYEVRFLFHLPYAINTSGCGTGIHDNDQDAVECWYEGEFVATVLHVHKLVRYGKLAFQWDCGVNEHCAASSALPMEAFLHRLERVSSSASTGRGLKNEHCMDVKNVLLK